jgi:hypothetical protein
MTTTMPIDMLDVESNRFVVVQDREFDVMNAAPTHVLPLSYYYYYYKR